MLRGGVRQDAAMPHQDGSRGVMSAEDHIRTGNLAEALAALESQVRADPASARHRIFLFQLLCVMGDWKRAIAQLKISAELDPGAVTMAQMYREAIICEVYRERVFAGEKEPLVFGEPQEWLAHLIEAQKHLAAGRASEAASARDLAFEMAPASPGNVNGTPFAWIADADSRLGPVLEVIVNGRYFWMPFTAIRSITSEPPADLRDYVWTPVTITLANSSDVVGLIPTRYAGTAASGDDAARLARKTEWTDAGEGAFVGLGQRLFATDAEDVAVLDLRAVAFDRADDGADE